MLLLDHVLGLDWRSDTEKVRLGEWFRTKIGRGDVSGLTLAPDGVQGQCSNDDPGVICRCSG